jgi:predicted DNA-binding transcriptional regulator AlpA
MTTTALVPEVTDHLPAVWLSPEQFGELIDVPVATIYAWRHKAYGPRPIKVGRHLRYKRADVERWLDSLSQGSAC